MLASFVSACVPSSRLILRGTLLWGNSSLPVPFMVDSGADDSFIDENVARHAGLPLVELTEPRTVQDLNGRTLARATHRTTSLTLLVSGNHREQIQLFLIPSSASPAVLGSPWLTTHNPQIDWTSGTITAWSVACHSLFALCSSPCASEPYLPFASSGSVGSSAGLPQPRGGGLQAAATLSPPTPSP